MNWILISSLWIVGFLLEMASFMEILGGKDVWVCLVYVVSCAVMIARTVPERQFSHAFMTGLIVGGTVWLTAVVRSTPHYPSGLEASSSSRCGFWRPWQENAEGWR